MLKSLLAKLLQRTLDAATGLTAAMLRRWRRLSPGHPVRMTPTNLAWDAYLRRRDGPRPRDLAALHAPGVAGLVSIVLPVHNGERHLAEALGSILAQTYRDFELIVVDDGSSDATPSIIARHAAADPRLRPLRQESAGLPGALNTGFAAARGELLTWTSDDNRLHPDFLEKMVAALRADPHADMVYADYDLIGEDGALLLDSPVCARLQHPPGSGHVRLLRDLSILNLINGNYIGGAFLYRARVRALLGDYSPHRFTCEDYDYFLRVNEQLCLRHVPFAGSVYDYRIHGGSLTARKEALQIDRKTAALMAFDDFRRDFALHPIAWMIEPTAERGARKSLNLAQWLKRKIKARGDLLLEPGTWPAELLPRFGFPAAYVLITAQLPPEAWARGAQDKAALPPGALSILVYTGADPLPAEIAGEWDLCLDYRSLMIVRIPLPPEAPSKRFDDGHACEEDQKPGMIENSFHNPQSAIRNHLEALWSALLIRIQSAHAARVEAAAAAPATLAASIVIATCRRPRTLAAAVRAVCCQTVAPERYEVLVVNNAPEADDLTPLIAGLGAELFPGDPARLRQVLCPLRGLSIARNAGLAEARGEIVVFIDDDAIAAPDLLEQLLAAYARHPECAVIGGSIILKEPVGRERPPWFAPAARKYWSHFEPASPEFTLVEDWRLFPWGANWSARRAALLEAGGFRCRYGRGGRQFSTGEDVVAALVLARLGGQVGIEPAARVVHDVDPARFTLANLARTIGDTWCLTLSLELDFYIERPAHWPRLLWQALRHLRHGVYALRKDRFESIESFFFALANLRLAARQLALELRRWRIPRQEQ